MGVSSLITKRFSIIDEESTSYEYFVGISRIEIHSEMVLEDFFRYITNLNARDLVMAQFINEKYILNQEHVFNACYFVQKTFKNKTNISNNPYIELFLYLAGNRQIKVGIDAFGITKELAEKGKLTFCLLSEENNIPERFEETLTELNATEIDFNINQLSLDKFHRIKSLFGITDLQMKSTLTSCGMESNKGKLTDFDIKHLFISLNDLICEKMALLSLENK